MGVEAGYGMWWDPARPENKVAGQLSWEPLKRPALSLLDTPSQEMMPVGDNDVPILHGVLADKGEVTLLACRWHGMHLGRTMTNRLHVKNVLMGIWLDTPEEACLRRVEAVFPSLALLLGDDAVRPQRRPKTTDKQVRFILDHRKLSWREDDVEASLLYKTSMSWDITTSTIEMHPTLELTSSTPKSLAYWIDQWLAPLNQLLATAIGKKSNPTKVSVWRKKHLKLKERMTQGVALWGQGIGEHEYVFDGPTPLFSAAAIDQNPGGLPDVLRRIRSLNNDQEVFLDLLMETIEYPDRPLPSRYLDLMSALEAYHSLRYGIAPIAMDTFKGARQKALAALKNAGVPTEHQKFLRRWLSTRPGFSLEYRLKELGERADTLSTWDVNPEQMARLRNDVAHGNAGLDYYSLNTACDQAFDLARQLVLHDLAIRAPGVPNHAGPVRQRQRPPRAD